MPGFLGGFQKSLYVFRFNRRHLPLTWLNSLYVEYRIIVGDEAILVPASICPPEESPQCSVVSISAASGDTHFAAIFVNELSEFNGGRIETNSGRDSLLQITPVPYMLWRDEEVFKNL
ncbi:MAG: hypothetical protein A2Y92_00505 [Chloroflexi bacterium RBG_13_57_8]|nr:MAG: hypothetical protein A2Y92_00505 [Chloroflexi bacterium RBG_13_57_8]